MTGNPEVIPRTCESGFRKLASPSGIRIDTQLFVGPGQSPCPHAGHEEVNPIGERALLRRFCIRGGVYQGSAMNPSVVVPLV
jgi:hypothetical protein